MVGIARVVVWTSKVAEMKWVFFEDCVALEESTF